jgi:hypothetical protein
MDDDLHFIEETSGNSGRMGRSIRRDVSVSNSRPSRLKSCLGYGQRRRSFQVINGQKKSVLAGLHVGYTTVASTTVPSMSTSTAPLA